MLGDWLVPPNVRLLVRALNGTERRSSRMRFLRAMTNWTVPAKIQSVVLGAGYAMSGLSVHDNRRLKNRLIVCRSNW